MFPTNEPSTGKETGNHIYAQHEGADSNTDKPLRKDNSATDYQDRVDEITNNDGSIIETLDTALHQQPGMIQNHSLAGSNRADYYESRSNGKTDAEEELEEIKKNHSQE